MTPVTEPLVTVLELLHESIERHERERRQHLPPSQPLPLDPTAWHRHDAAAQALTAAFEQIAGALEAALGDDGGG